MKKNAIRLILLFVTSFGFSQNIAIPYRDGNKWGICDADGKLIINAKFDKIEFYQNYSKEYEVLTSILNGLKGLIIKGTEILPPLYESIYEKGGNYVVTKIEKEQKTTDIILPNGKSILPKPIIGLITYENFSDRFQLIHVLNLDYTESIFVYNPTTNTISQMLYDNFYSLDLLKIRGIENVTFKVKKLETDALSFESWNFSNLPKELLKSTAYHKSEAELMKYFMENTYDRNNGGGYGGGSGDGRYSGVEEIRGDYDAMEVVERPSENNSEIKTKQPTYISNTFKIENEKLVLISQNRYAQNSPKTTIPVNLKIPVKDIEFKSYSISINKNDTITYFNNVVFYKKNNKTGMLFSSDTKNLIEFDSIVKTPSSLYDNNQNNKLIFIVANKDLKTKTYKYSLYTSKQKLLFPVQYDKLSPTNLSQFNSLKSYITQIGTKYGIIQNDGLEIAKNDYDELKEIDGSSSSIKIIQLKKNNKYSFITQKNNGDLQINSATFNYPAKDIIANYPKFVYKNPKDTTQIVPPTITLLELIDENKNLVGYANENGTLYFKN